MSAEMTSDELGAAIKTTKNRLKRRR